MFETSPAGAKFDAQFINEGREFNMNWDGVWHVKSRVTAQGWVTEIAIPFKTLRFNDADPQVWGVNFLRRNRRLNENSYWAPIPRIHSFARISLGGTLEDLSGLRKQRDIKVTPYAKGDVLREAEAATSTNFEAGLDAKLAVGSGLRLDLTLNTDFSQVEADVQQINLTRFSLFFPEKRDFFLENSGIFRFGPPTDPRVSQFQASFGSVAAPSNLRGGQSRGDDMFFFFARTTTTETSASTGTSASVPRSRSTRTSRKRRPKASPATTTRGGSLGPTTAACGSFETRSRRSKTTSTQKSVSRRVLG